MKFIALTVVLRSLLSFAQIPTPVERHEAVRRVIRHSLGWYDRWREPLGLEDRGATARCTVVWLQSQIFVYCAPFGITIHVEYSHNSRLMVQYMDQTQRGFQDALTESRLIGSTDEKPHAQSELTLSYREIAECRFDPLRSSTARTAVHEHYFRSPAPGRVLSYPKVCHGDPFYHVYVSRGGRLTSIREFALLPGKEEVHDNWYYDERRRNLPTRARFALDRKELWYAVEPSPQANARQE